MQEKKPLGWLQRLNEESWEAELLISAASIFVIFNSFTLLDSLVDFFIDHLPPNQYIYGELISLLGYFALGILGAFFAIHFALRAYWIGLVGLNSVFPDYSLKDSAYSERYTKKMSEKLPKLIDTIAALDEVCSVLFSAAFAFLLMYLNTSLILSLLLWVYNLSSHNIFSSFVFYILIGLGGLFILAIVFSTIANIKVFKENEQMQDWYYRLNMWVNKIILGPLYRYVLQILMTFGSNYKKRRFIPITIGIMLTFGFLFGISKSKYSNLEHLSNDLTYYDQNRLYPRHYRTNNTSKHLLLAPEIGSEVTSERFLELFVPLTSYERKKMDEACKLGKIDVNNSKLADLQVKWKAQLDCYSDNVTISIDDNPISVDLIKMEHPITEQFGLFTFINIKELELGAHQLSIVKKVPNEDTQITRIPFYFSPE
jgi:MFS family permease